MTPDDVKELNRWLLIQQLLYNPILGLVKASVLIFLFRIEDNRWFIRRTLQCFFVLNICLAIAIFLADLFQCTPIRYMYDSIMMDIEARIKAGVDPMTGLRPDGTIVTGGHCINKTAFVLSSAAITTVTEALTLLIPMAMVWNLKMARRKKFAVITILSLGWVVVACSIARLIIFSRLLAPDSFQNDASYGAQNQISTIEVNLAIITACAPACKALTKRLAPRFLSSAGRYSSAYKNGQGYAKSASRDAPSSSSYGHSRGYARGSVTITGDAGVVMPGRSHSRSQSQYYGKNTDVGIRERTESQEGIVGSPENQMVIERTVEVDIEMDDLDDLHKEGPGRRGVEGEYTAEESSKGSSREWRR